MVSWSHSEEQPLTLGKRQANPLLQIPNSVSDLKRQLANGLADEEHKERSWERNGLLPLPERSDALVSNSEHCYY